MEERILIILLGIIILLGLFQIGITLYQSQNYPTSYMDDKLQENKISYVQNTECSSDDILYSAYCLRKELMKFYNYTSNNTYEILTLQELKDKGGVCSHYAIWYKENMDNLGFYSQTITMHTKNYSHEITISYDNEFKHVCLMDQGEVICR